MSRGKMPFLFGLTAILLGVIAVPLSYDFSQPNRTAFRFGAVVLSLLGAVLVLIALRVEKKF